MKNTGKRSPKEKYLWHKPGFETLCIVLASPHFSLIADKKDFFYTQLENYTIMRFDVTTRQFVPVMHVQASLRRGSIRLDHAAARVPLPFLSSSHIRTNEYERERSQIEKQRETNTRYTRRRHLQKVEKQERKRAAFCTIVKSTDGREIESQALTCVGRNDPRARVHEALSRFIQRLRNTMWTTSRDVSLSTVTDTIYRDNSLWLLLRSSQQQRLYLSFESYSFRIFLDRRRISCICP